MTHAIFLDAVPTFLRTHAAPQSLLLAPVGAGSVFSRLHEAFVPYAQRSLVLAPDVLAGAVDDRLRHECPSLDRVIPLSHFRAGDLFEASDWVLLVDPRCVTLNLSRLPAILSAVSRMQATASHLVAPLPSLAGTEERVDVGDDGRIHRVQRYYEGATWAYVRGVACSLVSAACLRTSGRSLPIGSLADLRTALVAQGVPSRDARIEGGAYDLTREHELVRLNESAARTLAAERGTAIVLGADVSVHPQARLVGPVVVQHGATIGANATIIGPCVIGARAAIGSGAVVAQAVVCADVTVGPNAVASQRAVFEDVDAGHGATFTPAEPQGGWSIDIAYPDDQRRRAFMRIKLLVERTLAAAALTALSPVLLLLAVLVKLDSRGSIFYRDLREGLDGRPFKCLKFRTMRTGSNFEQHVLKSKNDVDGPQFKLEKDPRLTRLGRWLRPMSLDELPQLINVVRGEMSLIGPRPSPFHENQICVPWREARLSVRPGITGLWQVCRHNRREGDFHQWIYFDLLYVQHMSWSVDLKILLATLLTRGGRTHVPVHTIIPALRALP